MTSDLMPVHYFSEFSHLEVQNRLQCTLNFQWEACMNYCDVLSKEQSFNSDTDSKIVLRRKTEIKWKCYEKHHVPIEKYGKA